MSTYKVTLSIPTFHLSVVFAFRSAHEASVVHACISGRVSSARLPPIEWTNEPLDAGPPEIFLNVEDLKDNLLVQFSGAVQTPQYKIGKAGFHWDFSKVFTALILPRIVLQKVVPFHAATVTSKAGTVLLPGASGAGKSSIAFAAFQHGLSVSASELSFICNDEFITGNSKMTIDGAALKRYGTEMPPAAVEVDGRVVMPTEYQNGPLRLSRVMFPRICHAPLAIRTITARRARILLFKNVITELPVALQVAHETYPIGILPTKHELEIIAQQAESLSHLNPVIIEGSPEDVVAYISSPDADCVS